MGLDWIDIFQSESSTFPSNAQNVELVTYKSSMVSSIPVYFTALIYSSLEVLKGIMCYIPLNTIIFHT